jgi:hypothetical protein
MRLWTTGGDRKQAETTLSVMAAGLCSFLQTKPGKIIQFIIMFS